MEIIKLCNVSNRWAMAITLIYLGGLSIRNRYFGKSSRLYSGIYNGAAHFNAMRSIELNKKNLWNPRNPPCLQEDDTT